MPKPRPAGALFYEGVKTWSGMGAGGPARTGGVTDVRSLKMRRFMDRTSCCVDFAGEGEGP